MRKVSIFLLGVWFSALIWLLPAFADGNAGPDAPANVLVIRVPTTQNATLSGAQLFALNIGKLPVRENGAVDAELLAQMADDQVERATPVLLNSGNTDQGPVPEPVKKIFGPDMLSWSRYFSETGIWGYSSSPYYGYYPYSDYSHYGYYRGGEIGYYQPSWQMSFALGFRIYYYYAL